jgi:hypothetical protein
MAAYMNKICLLLIICAQASGVLCQSVRVTWAPSPTPDVTSYSVYYGVSDGPINKVVVNTETSTVISGLQPSVTYSFYVTASNAYGESDPSESVTYRVNRPPVTSDLSIGGVVFGGTGGYTYESNYCTTCSTPQVCNGSSVEISAYATGGTGPFQYYWTPTGETTQTITVNTPGVYTLSVIDAIGCTAMSRITVLSCEQCVTRTAALWASRVVAPSPDPCVTLTSVFNLMNNGRMDLGFISVTLDEAVGMFWAAPAQGQDDVCTARKTLARELIAAIANVTLLNADTSSCGVADPETGEFVLIGTLIQSAQAATQGVPNVLDCSTPGSRQVWRDEMDTLTGMLSTFNSGGMNLPLPGDLIDCGVGRPNAAYIAAHWTADPTTDICSCPLGP